MSMINLYDVLNVQQDCEMKDIEHAYKTTCKQCYPDNLDSNRESMNELLYSTYTILINHNTRKEYDNKLYKTKTNKKT
jgi:DnaJ-class molecular chaperone